MAETLDSLRQEAAHCTRCELYEAATQTVFGEGRADAWLVLVGEQPGDQEDKAGEPFVGPAGRVLAEVLDHDGRPTVATAHPSAILRTPPEARDEAVAAFVADLEVLAGLRPG